MEYKHQSPFLFPFFISLPLSIFFSGSAGNQTLGPMKARLSCLPTQDWSHHLYGLFCLLARLHVVPTNKVEGFLDIEPHGHLLTAEILN